VKLDFGKGFSGQVSYGFLHELEALEPGSQHRLAASIHYGAGGDRPVAVSLIWGRDFAGHGASDAVLLEGAWQITKRDHVFARAEWVEKDFELLASKQTQGNRLVRVDAYTFRLCPRLRPRGEMENRPRRRHHGLDGAARTEPTPTRCEAGG